MLPGTPAHQKSMLPDTPAQNSMLPDIPAHQKSMRPNSTAYYGRVLHFCLGVLRKVNAIH